MASAGQFLAQAPHSMHPSLSTISALRLITLKTLCGQTSAHLPHPEHFSSSKKSVATFAKYLCFIGAPYRIVKLLTNISRIPTTAETAISGTASFISLMTPENDVYVDEPVKFMAKNADSDGRSNM